MAANLLVLGDFKCIIPAIKILLPILSTAADPVAERD